MVYPTVTEVHSPSRAPQRGYAVSEELVLCRPLPADASWLDCLWFAWDEAQLDAERAYEAWCLDGCSERYAVYRAAQDRADAAQDALARTARA